VEAEAKVGNCRLCSNDKWEHKSEGFGHAYLFQDMEKEPILQMGSDKIIPKNVYDKPFTIRFPDRNEWREGFQPDRKGGIIWYADGSKKKKRHGPGVYCDGTRRKLSSREKCMPLRHVQLRI
jgi:hypothetical protein